MTALLTAVFLLAAATAHAGIATNLVQNGGFESNLSGNQPNPDTAGTAFWYTDESANGQLITTASANNGAVGVVWQFYFATPALIQDLGATVEAGKSYEVDFYFTFENTGSGANTNEMTFTFSLLTGASPSGPFTEVASFTDIADPTPADGSFVFINFHETIEAAQLIDVVGEYMQIQIIKDTGNSANRIYLDDVAFGPSDVATPTTLATDPFDELALQNIGDAAAVVTGEVTVAYIPGDPPTNVTITSVSVVDQSHPGFANLTSLPLTLTDPAPAGDTLLIEYDNTAGGLVVGETATGTIEIIWNEVGSVSSSTSTLPVTVSYLEVNSGNVIALFDHTGQNANPRLQGLVAEISGGPGSSTSLGSTDTTYGSLSGDARTDGGCYRASFVLPVISVAITNNTGYPAILDSLHFDAAKIWQKGPEDVDVSISGDLTSTNTGYAGLEQFNGITGDYDDFDIDLTGLADRTLAHGEAALIEFTFKNGYVDNSNAVAVVDNIALLGTGSNGAGLTRVPGGYISMGISKLDLDASQLIEMFYTEGDANTNIVITGVSFANETYPGSFSASGSFPLSLTVPQLTNEICTLEFDNTVANVPADDWAFAVMSIEWNEAGLPARTFDIDVYADNPADAPTSTNVITLVDTEFLTADAAIAGVKALTGGLGGLQYGERGSEDGTYGSISTNVLTAPTSTSRWQISGTNDVATLTYTNTTVADVELTSLHFDIGRWYASASDEFTLSISGDVTVVPALLVTNLSVLGFQVYDFDDHDVDLSGLADHTLAAGESVTFTITLTDKAGDTFYNVWIDNVALLGNFDAYGGWAADAGLSEGVNDDPGANPDGDNKDNLAEFSSGGDPLVADGPAGDSWIEDDGGTPWLYFVHVERQDDPALSYGNVGTKGDLLADPTWDTNDVEWIGGPSGPGLFKTVTNRTEATGTTKFIGVPIDRN
jgi:hypothetical protein